MSDIRRYLFIVIDLFIVSYQPIQFCVGGKIREVLLQIGLGVDLVHLQMQGWNVFERDA